MKKFLLRIENLLLVAPLLSLLLSKIYFSNSALDIHLHDTYFVIDGVFIKLLFFLYTSLLYVLYLSLRLRRIKINFWVVIQHVIGTCLAILLIDLPVHYEGLAGIPRRYYDYTTWNSFKFFFISHWFISSACFIFILAQIIFIIYYISAFLFTEKDNL